MTMKKGLGRGLDALFPSGFPTTDVLNSRSEGVKEISLELIKAHSNQPRKVFDDEKIEQLTYSIKEHGVLQPIVLIEQSGSYQIVAGERRYRAAKKAGLKTIPAVVRTASELQQLEIALVENIQREDLDPIEQALSIKRLHDDFSQGYDQIAKRLGKAETTLSNLVRLLGLPAPYQQALQDKNISEGHARCLLALSRDQPAQETLYKNILDRKWSVRRAELFVKAHKEGATAKAKQTIQRSETPATKRLSKKIGAPVTIQRTAKGGKIVIAFKGDDELAKILASL
jgi:ParB family chromosome partitioning protein